MATLYEEIVAAIDGVSGGPYPGRRAAHAKGTLCRGSFTASPAAGELSRAEHLSGETVPATVRFSNGSGNPGLPDNSRTDGRGMAVKLHLADGAETDSVTLTLPVFFARTAEDFLAFTRARRPDPATGQPDMERLGALLAEHPETAAALQLILPSFVPPASYATCAFNSLHAFALVDEEGERTWVRLRWQPEAGEHTLADDEIDTAGADYLQEELAERLAREPIRFRLVATLAEDGDPLDDPTVAWPEERERVELGELELTELAPPEDSKQPIVFDPNRLVDGVEPSDDEILAARSPAYSVSIARRSG
jgi:catalase